MSKPLKPKKKQIYRKRIEETCPFCGSKNIERTAVKHVGVIRICKDCGEQLD